MTDKEAIKELFSILKNYKRSIIFILLSLLTSSGIGMIMPLINSRVMDEGFIGGNWKRLIELMLLTLVCFFVNSAVEIFKEKKRLDISTKIKMRLEEDAFSHLMNVKISYFHNKNYAEILGNINMDISNISSIAEEHVFCVLTGFFSMLGGTIGLFILDKRLTGIVLLFLPTKFFAMKYFAKKRKQYMDSYIMEVQDYSGWFGDAIGGVREIRTFGIYNDKLQEFRNKKGSVIEKEKKMSMLGTWNSVADSGIIQIMMALLYIIGANYVITGSLSVGNIFAFINYSVYVTAPISAILNIGYYMSGILPSTKRFYEFMAYEEEVDSENIEQDVSNYSKQDIVFEKVSFAYDDATKVLDQVSFSIAPGSKTLLMGDNGSGKSTVLDLIMRFYEATDGKILLGGKSIADFALKQYRNQISVVTQSIYLFDDTIRKNIALYKDADDEEIKNACEQSGLADFIEEVSLDYRVGNNGILLSGGQKQKIAMARALIHDTPIVIFDEATSNADSESIKQINSLLHTRLKDKTVLVVSHQTEILQDADLVFVLQNGKIKKMKN